MSQNPSMQALVSEVTQMGNSVGAAAGSAMNSQMTWTKVLDAFNKVIGELQSTVAAQNAELSTLRAENAKLRQPVVETPQA